MSQQSPERRRATTVPDITGIVAGFIAGLRYEHLSSDVVACAKLLAMDSVANAVGGSALTPGRTVMDLFDRLGGTPEATVLASGARLPLPHAVYVNSFLANTLDYDDTYAALAHPGATAIPPALSVGEWKDRDGRAVVTAIVAAYEVLLRIALACYPTPERYRRVYGLGTYSVFGAVTAAASLMGLDAETARHALGLAAVNAPVPNMRKEGLEVEDRPFAWSKNNYGWAAMGGVYAALLAAEGFLGNRRILDGDCGFWVMAGSDRFRPEAIADGLGEQFLLTGTSFKPYAACRWTHSTLEAAERIRRGSDLRPEEIRRITVRSFYETARSLIEPHPANIIDAQFSIPFLVAVTLLGRSPAGGLREADLTDPEVRRLASLVRIEEDPEASRLLFEHQEMPSTVTVDLAGGRVLSEHVAVPPGDPRRPCTAGQVEDKLRALVGPVLGDAAVSRMVRDLRAMETWTSAAQVIRGWRKEARAVQ